MADTVSFIKYSTKTNSMNERLKKIIFKKLYNDLSNVEIISYKDSIWFINRENKYWYFEYTSEGLLWWRFDFFKNFFNIFCLERNESELVMSEWVEEVLNCKVNTPHVYHLPFRSMVEEVLNCSVTTLIHLHTQNKDEVEEVLNCKVATTKSMQTKLPLIMEEVLNHKVTTFKPYPLLRKTMVNEVLNYKVVTSNFSDVNVSNMVEKVLNHKVTTPAYHRFDFKEMVEEVLNHKVMRTNIMNGFRIFEVKEILNQ